MQSNWSIVALSDVLETIIDYRGKTPPKSKDGIAVLTAASVKDGRVLKDKVSYISQETYEKVTTRGFPKKGDVLITTEAPVGEVAPFPVDKTYHITRRIMALRGQSDVIDSDFLLYALLGPNNQSQLKACIRGSTVPRVLKTDITGLKFPLPPLLIQKQIGRFLASVDEKIHLNNQTNQTLEQMAQAIFKSWFVDFDPVKAKMNGEQPEGMDAATASLFPEKLDSETGIPVGWSQGVIADIAKVNAKSWTKKNQPEQVHYVDLANTKNGVIETVTSYDFSEAPSRARRILNSGDTIVGTVRPGNRSFAFIGDTEQPLTGSTGFAVLSPKEECWTSFVYLATTNDDSIDEYARLADGGAYPAIKPVVVADTPCVIPTTDIAQKFWQLTGAMLKKAHQNRLENEELAKLRDTLLPKLLSGEITLD
ncbi:restriction endonuclease subunit S [Vibrio vulnificus]|nr:restriction endonuclease subunit S [Vibrio vulnificus]EID0690927.1 restriction endonuclease subunit S [Vibrio vulnificus]EIX4872573.1 restriction endonuclease subunit S [Vibrio vulnificus]HAS8310113.1 restriction endonuclease subunit S [Vibrio vulnificus]HAS8553931.1 restriction endonuclease subunit S [Vibrio vulnificus]